MQLKLKKGDALLIVDPQLDFMPGGALAVPEGDKILPIVNKWIRDAEKAHIPIFISRDWHPTNHVSFKAQGGPWPPHCVQYTRGAEFHPDLYIPANVIIISKASEAQQEAYSAFQGITNAGELLGDKLQKLHVKQLWVAGLALDYCVHHSVIDAHQHGFISHILLPACRSIAKETEEKTLADLKRLNVIFEFEA